MKKYIFTMIALFFTAFLLSACNFEADRNNPYDYKNIKTGWNVPVKISSSDANTGSADMPQVGMSSNGEAVAVWKQHVLDADKYGVFVNKINLRENKSWKDPIQIGGSGNSECQMPQVAVNQNGDSTVAWLEFSYGDSQNNIWVKSCPAGKWGGESWVNLPSSGTTIITTSDSIQNLKISKNDSMHSAMVTWYQDDGGTNISVFARVKFTDSGDFTDAYAIPSSYPLSLPALGNEWASAIVAFDDATGWNLQSSSLILNDIASGWIQEDMYASGSPGDDTLKPIDFDIDYNMSGKSITAYCLQGNNDMFAVTTNQDTINSPEGMGAGHRPRVAMNKYGDGSKALFVFIDDSDQVGCRVIELNSDTKITKAEGTTLSDNSFGACAGLDIAMDDYGNAIAIWIQGGRLYTVSWGLDWQDIKAIDAGGTVNYDYANPDLYQPRVAMDANGNAVVVWVEDTQIMARLYLR